jgi:TRAP-type uncharacterized transport system fused permease subunit
VVGVSPLRYRRCIALGGFIVPYMFLFSHELLLIFEEGQNQWLAGILAFLTACVGITVLVSQSSASWTASWIGGYGSCWAPPVCCC